VRAGLWQRCSGAPVFLLPRAGAHHGLAISRDGDYLGGSVNLAARVAGLAGGGQVLVTTAVALAAAARGMEVAELGPHWLHNVSEPVELFEIRLGASEHPDVIDPVCRMRVEPEFAAGSLCHQGRRFWFCSMPCVAAFAADPDRYLIAAGLGGTSNRVPPPYSIPAGQGRRSLPGRGRGSRFYRAGVTMRVPAIPFCAWPGTGHR
jgi:YHS domain-containing protein